MTVTGAGAVTGDGDTDSSGGGSKSSGSQAADKTLSRVRFMALGAADVIARGLKIYLVQ